MTTPTQFETSLLTYLHKNGEIPASVSLDVKVVERWFTGIGSYTDFEELTDLQTSKLQIISPDVFIEFESTENGGGCLIYLFEGSLTCIEVFNYGSELPINYMEQDYKFSKHKNNT